MKRIFCALLVTFIASLPGVPVFADSMPIVSGRIIAPGVSSFADFTLSFRDIKSLQSTQVKVDSKGNFIGQVPTIGEYRIFLNSQTKCISGSFNYLVESTGQKLEFSLPRFAKYEFSARNSKGNVVSNVSFALQFELESASNPAIGDPVFGCSSYSLGTPNSVSAGPVIVEGFLPAQGARSLGTATYTSALSQKLTVPIVRPEGGSTKVDVALPSTPEIQINSKTLKFKKQTVTGSVNLKMPDEFGTIITDRVVNVYLRNNLGGTWGRWFIIRSMRLMPGVPATFTNNLSAYKGAQVDIGFRGSDFSSELVFARVKVPK